MAVSFVPRAAFPVLDSVPRSYYLGHHAAGLAKMRTMLSQIDLIIECRDYRVPLTSHNPLFEESLAGRERMVVYTKKDLGRKGGEDDNKVRREERGSHGLGADDWELIYRLCREKHCFANGTILPLSCSQTSMLHETFAKCSNTLKPLMSRATA